MTPEETLSLAERCAGAAMLPRDEVLRDLIAGQCHFAVLRENSADRLTVLDYEQIGEVPLLADLRQALPTGLYLFAVAGPAAILMICAVSWDRARFPPSAETIAYCFGQGASFVLADRQAMLQ